MGVYGLAWSPAFIFETIWTPGPNFWSKGPLAPNLKIAIFSQKLTIWVSMDSPGPQQSYLRQFGHRGQILGPRALWPQIHKTAIFSQNPSIWVSMDSPRTQQTRFDTLSWLGTPRPLRSPRVCGGLFIIFVTYHYNMVVYGLYWTPTIRI